ncbi:MAG TPA: RagB/SusD family nutrient uptake outer membrane protein [Chryseosolibacter sp.]|nr:RagB/SusD family nutrient uptake outer membrane protein [Chryseosolibacter sp.]
MKKVFKYLSIVGLTLASASCGEEFIDRYPLDRPNPANFFIDDVSARQAVNAAYQPWTRNADMFQRDAIIVWDAMTDDSYWRPSRGPSIAQERWDITATHGAINNYWELAFQSINNANFAIQGIPMSSDPNFTEEEKLPYIAEARFMRGFAYLFLVSFFGDVPLIDKPLSTFEEYHQARVAKSEVFDQIIADFEFAKQNLPDEQPGAEGAAVKATAAAYLAKAYLYSEDWANTATAAVDAIAIAQSTGFALVSDYLSIWDHANEGNPELLFYISYAHNSEQFGQNMTIQRISRSLPPQLRYIYGAGDGWGYALPQRDLYDAFESEDPRRGYTLFAPGDVFGIYNQAAPFTYTHERYDETGKIVKNTVTYNNGDPVTYDYRWSETGLNVRKMIMNMEGITNVRWAGQDVPLMRMADLYLMAAEAYARQGNPLALTYVNAVRARPSVNMPPRVVGDGRPGSASLLDIVKHERRVELAMEGIRLFDLLRWGELKTVFGDGTKVKRHFYSDYVTRDKFDNPLSYLNNILDPVLFPIPQAELDANQAINVNNPGWD